MATYLNILETPVEFLPSVGPYRADLLKKELNIFQFQDLLYHFPFRYVDKTQFHRISEIPPESTEPVQLKGVLRRIEVIGEGSAKRASATFRDESGSIELVWFRQIHWAQTSLIVGQEYIIYGRPSWYGGRASIPHPEVENVKPEGETKANSFEPVYSSSEKLNAKGLDTKGQRKLVRALLEKLQEKDLVENLPSYISEEFKLMGRRQALYKIHFPEASPLRFPHLVPAVLTQFYPDSLQPNHRKNTCAGWFLGFFDRLLP